MYLSREGGVHGCSPYVVRLPALACIPCIAISIIVRIIGIYMYMVCMVGGYIQTYVIGVHGVHESLQPASDVACSRAPPAMRGVHGHTRALHGCPVFSD